MPSGGLVNSVNINYTSNKDIDRLIMETMDRYPDEFTKFTKTSTSTERYIKEAEMAALGPLVYKPEGSAKELASLKQGNTKTITFKNYSLAVAETEEARDWDKQGVSAKIPTFLGNSGAYSKEITGIDLFLSGFVTTTRAGIDGKALFANDHVILDPWTGAAASTYDNLLPAATLSASQITAARNYFENLNNSLGLPVVAGRRILLVVGTGLRDTAKLLLENEYEVDSSNRNMNINKDTMSYMVSHYLGSTHTGYYFVDLDLMDLRHIISKPFSSKTWDDNLTDNKMHSLSGRWAFDFVSTYGVCASAGA